MTRAALPDEIDLYVWEGSSDLCARAVAGLDGYDVNVVRADMGLAFPPPRAARRIAVALVSVTVMGDARFAGHDWLATHAIPVIWVAGEERGRDPRYYPPAYSHTLPLGFGAAELRALLFRVAGVAQEAARSRGRSPRPLVAVSEPMRALLAEVEMFADCRTNVLVHGETGVGKERIARLLHERAAWSGGPFVAVNCGAIPEGLFEAHFFGHAKGAFTGATFAHKGYFEQAHEGTLFLDEIGDLPLYQQVKLLRVLEQGSVTRLGSAAETPVDFRLVAASNRDLRSLVAQGAFRADLYYRLAVIELHVPSLQARGPEEKVAIFASLLEHELGAPAGKGAAGAGAAGGSGAQGTAGPGAGDSAGIPDWLVQRVAATHFPGNVRELANMAERVAIVRRQCGGWDRPRIERVFERQADDRLACAAGAQAEAQAPLSPAEQAERARIVAALDANGWRRQDTAHYLGISRKVLWEKMRKLQIAGSQGESLEGLAQSS